jgi:tubulin polyglutamylase TTLL5
MKIDENIIKHGTELTDKIADVPLDESCVISRYITNPLLINGYKFDLRLYKEDK